MNLGIIIPLKSSQVSSNWQSVCNSLASTVFSIIKQTNNSYKVIIVGHEKPSFIDDLVQNAFSEMQFNFHSIKEISPPKKAQGAREIPQEEYTKDKNMKIAKGIQLLKKIDETISHWFVLDADDLIHKDFIKICDSSNIQAGAIINQGYLYYANSQRVVDCSELSLYCGSTGIIATELIEPPDVITYKTIQQIPFCSYAHMHLDQFFIHEKSSYVELKEKLITYVLANGENISDGYRDGWLSQLKTFLKPYVKGKKLSATIRENFSID